MSLLESASVASHRRARAAARLQSPQDDANTDNDAVEPQDDANTDNDAVEPQDDAKTDNNAVEPQDDANVNNDSVAPKYAADARSDADDPSSDESSTDTADDRAASIRVNNLAAAIANATNARRPTPNPLYTTITDAYEVNWNPGDTKQMATFVRAAEPDSDHVRFDVGVPNASTLMDLVDDKASLYLWDHLMNVPVKGTGVIALLPKVLINGNKVCDAGFGEIGRAHV